MTIDGGKEPRILCNKDEGKHKFPIIIIIRYIYRR